MMDEFETIKREHHPGVITGKSLPLGESEGRGDATARGGICVVRESAKLLGMDLAGKTKAIQGFGNAGQFAALLRAEGSDQLWWIGLSRSVRRRVHVNP